MLNMILNTILQPDKNGLRPLNAISLARVSAPSSAKEYGDFLSWESLIVKSCNKDMDYDSTTDLLNFAHPHFQP